MNLARRDVEVFGQAASDERNGVCADVLARVFFFKEEVTALVVDVGHNAAVDFVRVGDYFALFALAVNLREITHVELSAFDEVVKHVANANRSELVLVADKHEARASFECVYEC